VRKLSPFDNICHTHTTNVQTSQKPQPNQIYYLVYLTKLTHGADNGATGPRGGRWPDAPSETFTECFRSLKIQYLLLGIVQFSIQLLQKFSASGDFVSRPHHHTVAQILDLVADANFHEIVY